MTPPSTRRSRWMRAICATSDRRVEKPPNRFCRRHPHPRQEEHLPPSNTASSLESSQAGQEQTGVDSSRSDDFTLFLQDVRNRLEQAKSYPWLARIQGQEGTVRVQFMIDSSGEAHEIRLLESSRSMILDQEAVETVKRAGRFSHLPASWNKTIQVNVPLVFQLNPP